MPAWLPHACLLAPCLAACACPAAPLSAFVLFRCAQPALQFHIPHGVANALLISHVIRYNATDKPMKQAAFPQVGALGCLPRPCPVP